MNPTATLNGHCGTLRVTVLGFEDSDATIGADGASNDAADGHEDPSEWIVARVEWESRTARIGHEGAILLTTELDALAAALADGGPRSRALRFIEPNFAITRSAPADGDTAERVTIAIAGEPQDGHPSFEASTWAAPAAVRAFGRALRRIAQSLRATPWPAFA
jgi:hypothetical protein